MLQALAATPGHVVLDLGCGPGTDLGPLAAAVTAAGLVTGIDLDPVMADHARASQQGRPQVSVLRGDAHALPVRAASVDRVWSDRLLQHVTDPAWVLAEMRRVLRPHGRIVMAEPDWESLAFDHPDPESSRAYTRHLADQVVRNGAIGRHLPRLAQQAGLEVGDVSALTAVLRDAREADQVLGFQRNAQRAVDAGYLTAGAAQEWLDALADGPFLAAVTLYVVTAELPAAGGA
jgi:SAM-dependent methyltransferase